MGVIVTTGLLHGGTTILNLLVGAHSRHIAVGEAHFMLRSTEQLTEVLARDRTCSCGAPALECALWGPFLREMFKGKCKTHLERYQLFLDYAGEFGVPVDSSKGIKGTDDGFAEAKFIFIVKDVRSWAFSYQLRAEKVGWKRVSMPRLFLRWYKGVNRKLRELEGMDYTTVGYDQLAIHPTAILPRICDWLEVPFEASMLKPDLTRSHVLHGNAALLDLKRSTVRYDDRWLADNSWAVASMLFPWVMRENTRLVWSTGTQEVKTTAEAALSLR